METKDFKFTIFRRKKDGTGETVQAISLNSLIDSIKTDSREALVTSFRNTLPYIDRAEGNAAYLRIPRLCAASEYYRNKAGKHVFRAYNGVSIVIIDDLTNSLEVEKAKKQAAMMPQTLLAMTGVDNRSVVVFTVATLPDGSLPKDENAALLFATQAYMTSVKCLQPLTEFNIRIEQPTLNSSCKMTVDEHPYVNPHPVQFIIEQPTDATIRMQQEKRSTNRALARMVPGAGTMVTYIKVFNAAFHRAMEESGWREGQRPELLITHVAELCHDSGLPEEETTMRLHAHFRDLEIEDVRAIVNNVYETKGELPENMSGMKKHQLIAYNLKEFIARRYDIRFNTVLQMTEFRERHSFRFLYRELTKRELNTIFHEAQLEGISPTFGEVESLVHSTLIPNYNPIEEFLGSLPDWDGRDRMTEVAEMVPTDNPHWVRLFRQWFLSMVAHWMNNDVRNANSTAPILIGEQGFRKSTFCRQLLPPELQQFYTDSIDFRSNTEADRALSRFLIINIDEFDQLSERQSAYVKHLFQKPSTSIRRMHSEAIGVQRRYASFMGTTNCDEVLRDPTGNRRYLCVKVTDKIKTDIAIDYRQLYAQALHMINKGMRYWINDEDELLIRSTNKRFEVHTPLEDHFLSAFSSGNEMGAELASTNESEWLSLPEIMEELLHLPSFNKRTDCNLVRLGKILTKLGIQKQRRTNGIFYLVKRIAR